MASNCPILTIKVSKTIYIQWEILKNSFQDDYRWKNSVLLKFKIYFKSHIFHTKIKVILFLTKVLSSKIVYDDPI